MLSRVTLTLFISLVFLSPVAAVQTDHTGDLDPKCDPGYYPGFETSPFQFDLAAYRFFDATDSFQHTEWYTGPILSTNGPDNTIGSTRTGNLSGATFTERLVEYSRTSTKLSIQFESVAPITFLWIPKPVTFGYYREEWNVESICAGTATYFTMVAKYCAKDVVGAYSLFYEFRRYAMAGLAKTLGAEMFEGTCPDH